MRSLLFLAMAIVVSASACDAQEQANVNAAKDVKDARAEGKAHPAPTKAASDAPVTFKSLSECLETCEAPGMIPTNRETCKLNCDTAYGAQPAAGGGVNADVVGAAATCLGRCYASDASPDACAGGCKTTASAAPTAPTSAVLDSLGTCIQTCHADKKLRPTNEATCELNCTQLARVAGPAQPTKTP
jgi:hypothetical protein